MPSLRPTGAACSVVGWLALLSCGSEVQEDGSGGATSSSATGGADPCEAPSGERLCFGPNECDPSSCLDGSFCVENGGLTDWSAPDGEDIGYCIPPAALRDVRFTGCEDGGVVNFLFGDPHYMGTCINEALARLYCDAGRGDLLAFADYGTYDCAPLPAPTDCPVVEGFKLCGDACGSCRPDEVCRGRSRLHPYSMCVPVLADGCDLDKRSCEPGFGCFIYTVDTPRQAAANALGLCLPTSHCEAAAAGLPGGAECLH